MSIVSVNNPSGQERIQELASRAARVTPNAHGGFTCLCPAHNDTHPSLSVNLSDTGYIVMHCLSHDCGFRAIMDAWSLPVSLLFPEGGSAASAGTRKPQHLHGSLKPKDSRSVVDAAARDHLEDKIGKATEHADANQSVMRWWARHLGISVKSLRAFGCGTSFASEDNNGTREYYLLIPEFGSDGEICNINTRCPQPFDGRDKFAEKGLPRGLAIAKDEKPADGHLLCFEGASDPMAANSVGLNAIGRPNARGGADLVAIYAAKSGASIVIFGENDEKPDGSWPGRDGCQKVSQEVCDRLNRSSQSVSWCLPPKPFKDFRDWLNRSNVDLNDKDSVAAFRDFVLTWVADHAVRVGVSPEACGAPECPDSTVSSPKTFLAPEESNSYVKQTCSDNWCRCPKRYSALLGSKLCAQLEIMMHMSCKTWSCPECAKCLKERWIHHLDSCFRRQGGSIYVYRGNKSEWEAVVKYIRRQGDYNYVHVTMPNNEFAVASSVPIDGRLARRDAHALSPAEATQWIAEIISSLPACRKPIATSRGAGSWQPPKLSLRTDMWTHLGTVKNQDIDAIRAAAKEFDVRSFKEKPQIDSRGKIFLIQSWLLPKEWTPQQVENWHQHILGRCYRLNGPLTRAECQQFLDDLAAMPLTG